MKKQRFTDMCVALYYCNIFEQKKFKERLKLHIKSAHVKRKINERKVSKVILTNFVAL